MISCGNISEEERQSPLYKQISALTKPIFEDSLKEVSKNHVSVGGVGIDNYEYAFYNPHNARFYFDYIKTDPLTDPRLSSLETINKSEKRIEDFFGCRIVVKKNKIEVTNKVDKERRFRIDGSAVNRHNQCVEAVATLEREAIASLKEFIKAFGGSSSFVCVKMWIPDNKILHDKLVDSIALENTFRNDVVKKVYNSEPKNVEYSSPAYTSNAFRNMGLHDYAPIIASELECLRSEIMKQKSFLSPLEEIKLSIDKFPDDVFRAKEPIMKLSESDRELLSFWFFEQFGEVY